MLKFVANSWSFVLIIKYRISILAIHRAYKGNKILRLSTSSLAFFK